MSSSARAPYRVVVFGPGKMGSVAIWELSRRPEFELVGVRGYSAEKAGRDPGELIGVDPVGVTITTDREQALAIDCDCILYTARDMGNNNTDEEIFRLLSAGRNVVTPIPYNNAALWREPEFNARLAKSCSDGGSSFHSTGMSPDMISERIALALTGMSAELQSFTIRENWPVAGLDPVLLQAVGIGAPLELAEENPVPAIISKNILMSVGYSAERAFGVTFDSIEESHAFVASPVDVDVHGVRAAKGTVGRVTHRFEGRVDAVGPDPLFTLELNWYLGNENLPQGVNPGEYWVVEMEGVPSARMVIDLRTSLANENRSYKIGKIRTDPGYHATIAACMQAIPHVVAAEPGVLPTFEAPLHWKADLRIPVSSGTADVH
jgi:4-hydroxy-tetrahydrodipicolinate reductase